MERVQSRDDVHRVAMCPPSPCRGGPWRPGRPAHERSALAGKTPTKYGRLPHVVLDRRHPRAPERRWWLLMLLALVPFGGHFFKNALSALQPFLPLSATQYGALHSTFALPNATIAPMLGGLLYDSAQLRRWATPIFALLAFCGGVLCVGGLGLDDLALTYAGGVTLGLGQGCVVVACRAIASTFSHAAFAQGLLAGVANLASFLAKSGAAPVAANFDLGTSLLVMVAAQGLSLTASFFQGAFARKKRPHHFRRRNRTWWHKLRFLRTERFWLVALAHGVFVCGFKVFENFSSIILVRAYGFNPEKAGFIASVVPLASIFLAPLAGLLSDRSKTQLPCVAAMVLAIGAFGVLSLPPQDVDEASGPSSAPLPVLAIAVSHAVLPTLLLAKVRGTVNPANVGAAFGACEFVVACGNVVANVLFSWVHGNTEANEALYLLLAIVVVGLLLFLRLLAVGELEEPPGDDTPRLEPLQVDAENAPSKLELDAARLRPEDDSASTASESTDDSDRVRPLTPRLWP